MKVRMREVLRLWIRRRAEPQRREDAKFYCCTLEINHSIVAGFGLPVSSLVRATGNRRLETGNL
jgi:hypothetical protein